MRFPCGACVLAAMTLMITPAVADEASPAGRAGPAASKPKPGQLGTSPQRTKPSTRSRPTPGTTAKPGTLDLRTLQPTLTPSPARVDLFPSHIFGKGSQLQFSEGPEGKRLNLGDDGNWKVQAAQVGAMALGWLALVKMCANGRCKLPADLLPDFLQSRSANITGAGPSRGRQGRSLGR